MSRKQLNSSEVVSKLLEQSNDLIDSITNDEELQLRVVFDESSGTRGEFEDSIENVVGSVDGGKDVDFIEVNSEYVAIISL